jgi:hypothetical protein
MSHRDDCPSRWEAERQGERAQEWGRSRSSNPHESLWPDEGCPEAAEAWRSGYRRAEMREEEQREEEAARHRAEMHRAELEATDLYQSYDYPAEEWPVEPFLGEDHDTVDGE